jgi:hypothetical protein
MTHEEINPYQAPSREEKSSLQPVSRSEAYYKYIALVPNPIIRKNLERMIGTNKGDMRHEPANFVSIREAPPEYKMKFRKCFYYNNETGEIMYFGYPQNVPPEIRENFPDGEFIIGIQEYGFADKPKCKTKIFRVITLKTRTPIPLLLTIGNFNHMMEINAE